MNSKSKDRLLLIAGILVFLVAAAGITGWLTKSCIPYTAKADKIHKTLYSDDEDMDQVDVCLIGGSHGLNAFNPHAMWDEAGLHAYNYCYAGETIGLTNVYLKELFKKRSFSLVVADIYYAGLADRYFGEKDYSFDVLNKMDFSFAKFGFVNDHVQDENKRDYYFPLYRYHSRWDELTKQDKERKPDVSDDWMLGFDTHTEINSGEEVHFNAWEDHGQSMVLCDPIESEIRDLIKTVEENGAKLLLVDLPRRYNDSNQPGKWVGDEYAAVNRVKEIAREYKVDVLQYDNKALNKIGFVPEKHMYNKGHMNLSGSDVFSRALARYITEHHDIPVYSKNNPEDLWNQYYNRFVSEYY